MHNSTHDNTNLPFPFPDALQEFSVATGGLSAANGTHSGASVNAVTKSGTNSFHGNAFEFVRDSRFNATGAFAPVGQDGKRLGDGLNRNVFGGTVGGPLVKDKLFFFGGYERQRARQVTPDNLAFVPTAAMLAGDFSAPASAACRTAGPLTLRAPFVNNQIDPARYSPAAVKIATSGWLPTTTDPCGAVRYSVPINSNQEQYVARLDYHVERQPFPLRAVYRHERALAAGLGADAQRPRDPGRVQPEAVQAIPDDGHRRYAGVRRQHGQRRFGGRMCGRARAPTSRRSSISMPSPSASPASTRDTSRARWRSP